jgi:hypothetical protein
MKLWSYFSVHLQLNKVPEEIKTIRSTQFLTVHETIDQLCGIDESTVNGINEIVSSLSMSLFTSIFWPRSVILKSDIATEGILAQLTG